MAKGDFGFNGSISNRGVGHRRVRVVALDFGLEIISSSDAEARSRRAFYPVVTDGSSFAMTLAFVSWAEREAFNRWMSGFMTAVSEGVTKHGTMTVRVPSRNFVRVGVPQGDLEYGEGVTDVAYPTQVSFVGAHDPLNLDLSSRMAGTAYYQGPRRNAKAQFFYPSGKQLKGAEALDGAIFDSSPADAVETPSAPSPTLGQIHLNEELLP